MKSHISKLWEPRRFVTEKNLPANDLIQVTRNPALHSNLQSTRLLVWACISRYTKDIFR